MSLCLTVIVVRISLLFAGWLSQRFLVGCCWCLRLYSYWKYYDQVKEATDTDPNAKRLARTTLVPTIHPKSPLDFGQASVPMFSLRELRTLPTIQADRGTERSFQLLRQFANAHSVRGYPDVRGGWWLLGGQGGESVVDSLCDGPAKL